MLRFGRVSLSRVARQLSSVNAAAAEPSTPSRTIAPQWTQGIALPVEHHQLQAKFTQDLSLDKPVENIFDVVERIEWNNQAGLGRRFLNRVFSIITSNARCVNEISDRQLALVLSVFGDCDTINGSSRQRELDEVLKALKDNGTVLGPMSRCAVFKTKIDNGQCPNVVEEIKEWDAAKLDLSEDILEQFARAYAHGGNIQGVVDIINHMKSSGMIFGEAVARHLVYSLAFNGHFSKVDSTIQKFAASMNEVVLRCAAAAGAIQQGHFDEAIQLIVTTPSSLRISSLENSTYVLDVMCDMIEKGYVDAFNRLSTLINAEPDGTTLQQKNNISNNRLMVRTRRARAEGMIEAALEIFGRIHPFHRHENLKNNLLESFVGVVKKSEMPLDDIFSIGEKMKKLEILRNPELFILEVAASTDNVRGVFNRLVKEGKLESVLKEKPFIKRNVAKSLSSELLHNPISHQKRVSIIVDIATVLFSYTGEVKDQDFYKIIYGICGRDVNILLEAMPLVKEWRARRDFATAGMHQVLYHKEDALREEKINKLLERDDIGFIIAGLKNRLKSLLLNTEKLLGEDDDRQLERAAKILSLSSTDEFNRGHCVNTLQEYVTNEGIPLERLKLFAQKLQKFENVKMLKKEIDETKNKLRESGLGERCSVLDSLKKGDQAIARWMKSPMTYLESIFEKMETSEDTNPKALQALMFVIMRKFADREETSFVIAERYLRKIHKAKWPGNVLPAAREAWQAVFASAVEEGKVDVAEKLWEIRPDGSFMFALPYISLLFIHNEIDKANAVCEELRQSAVPISGAALEKAGRMMAQHAPEKVSELSTYLEKKLSLKENQTRMIVAEIRSRQLKELIASGKPEEGLQLALKESAARGVAFGQFELFKESFVRNDPTLTKSVYMMVLNTHDKTLATLDLAYAMLEHRLYDHARKLFEMKGLKISNKEVTFFVDLATKNNRPDVLREMFFGLNNNRCATMKNLEIMLLRLAKLYYQDNRFDELRSLAADLKEVSFPVGGYIKKVFENLLDRSPSTDVFESRWKA